MQPVIRAACAAACLVWSGSAVSAATQVTLDFDVLTYFPEMAGLDLSLSGTLADDAVGDYREFEFFSTADPDVNDVFYLEDLQRAAAGQNVARDHEPDFGAFMDGVFFDLEQVRLTVSGLENVEGRPVNFGYMNGSWALTQGALSLYTSTIGGVDRAGLVFDPRVLGAASDGFVASDEAWRALAFEGPGQLADAFLLPFLGSTDQIDLLVDEFGGPVESLTLLSETPSLNIGNPDFEPFTTVWESQYLYSTVAGGDTAAWGYLTEARVSLTDIPAAPAPVPLPASIWLLGSTLGVLVLRRRARSGKV